MGVPEFIALFIGFVIFAVIFRLGSEYQKAGREDEVDANEVTDEVKTEKLMNALGREYPANEREVTPADPGAHRP
jgi:hypothetical protein